ncbi:MAG: OmpA family protein [Anaerolineales bacterium]|nr:OmpA family protein [Anaerolineales bacterium]
MRRKRRSKLAKIRNQKPTPEGRKHKPVPSLVTQTHEVPHEVPQNLRNREIPSQQRQQLAQQINQQQGNRVLNRLLEGTPEFLQRNSGPDKDQDTVQPGNSGAQVNGLPTFDQAEYTQEGDNFDATYRPKGPTPKVGELEITHWVHIDFKDFDKKWIKGKKKYTPAQIAEFNWTDEQKEKFTHDFMVSVSQEWGGKYMLHLDDPTFSSYRCNVSVNVIAVSDPDLAHTNITARKYPTGTDGFRSEADEEEATLESRDPSEDEEKGQVANVRPFIRQVGDFEFDDDTIKGDLPDQVKEIDELLKENQSSPLANKIEWRLVMVGTASSEGKKAYNKRLGKRRAQSVKDAITTDLSWIKEVKVDSSGERGTTTDARFRMVIVTLRSMGSHEALQNVAAHEFGHMIGLGDEYTDIDPKEDMRRFPGDEPDHYEEVEKAISVEAANETLTVDSDSIMSAGNLVKPAHYIHFLQAIRDLTGNPKWQIEK